MDLRVQHYDQNGWEATCPGWHEYDINVDDTMGSSETYSEVLDWLYNRIDNCERHARWRLQRGLIQLKFRYERDVILCKLSF
jgi:hypothetical protein